MAETIWTVHDVLAIIAINSRPTYFCAHYSIHVEISTKDQQTRFFSAVTPVFTIFVASLESRARCKVIPAETCPWKSATTTVPTTFRRCANSRKQEISSHFLSHSARQVIYVSRDNARAISLCVTHMRARETKEYCFWSRTSLANCGSRPSARRAYALP